MADQHSEAAQARRWTFDGVLGRLVAVWHGPACDYATGEVRWQIVIGLTVPALEGGGEGTLTDVWTVPEDATEAELAEGIHARVLALLSHEVLEAMRWCGRPVFDAHPIKPAEGEAANGEPRLTATALADAKPLRPWA